MSLRPVIVAGLLLAAFAAGACDGSEAEGEDRETITVFAAASLTDAFGELAAAFERAHSGVTVRLAFGGSATLRTQVLEGAPADVFASASPEEVEALADAGLVLEQRALAENALIVAVERGNERIASLADLATPGLRLVLAAEAVPAGRYARQTLALAEEAGAFGPRFAARTLSNVRSNEPSVRAALAKVELGEADAAIVYASDLAGAQAGVRAVAIPARYQVAAEYRIALLTERAPARAFLAFATSPRSAAILARHGFRPAGGTP